jgi:hypothetical protein
MLLNLGTINSLVATSHGKPRKPLSLAGLGESYLILVCAYDVRSRVCPWTTHWSVFVRQGTVRNHLFPKWKFFTSKEQMSFTDRKGGIILKIRNDLHVQKESHIYWWDMNKKAILAALNRKRNDVTAYLKKHFCCKFWNCRMRTTQQIL